MGYLKGMDRSQLMLPTSLEEWVSEDNPVRIKEEHRMTLSYEPQPITEQKRTSTKREDIQAYMRECFRPVMNTAICR